MCVLLLRTQAKQRKKQYSNIVVLESQKYMIFRNATISIINVWALRAHENNKKKNPGSGADLPLKLGIAQYLFTPPPSFQSGNVF